MPSIAKNLWLMRKTEKIQRSENVKFIISEPKEMMDRTASARDQMQERSPSRCQKPLGDEEGHLRERGDIEIARQ